jgi:hypothetical protein
VKHIENAVSVSVFEAREIAKRLERCISDVKMGVPITECNLDAHLDELMKIIDAVFNKSQPDKPHPEIPI